MRPMAPFLVRHRRPSLTMRTLCTAFVQIFNPPHRVIQDLDGRPYLTRYYLLHVARRWLPGVFLHHFHRGDGDRDTHNHPWRRAISVILVAGYIEERLVGSELVKRVVRPWSINFINANDYHRVDLLEHDAWSLFIAGKKEQDWGFKIRETGEYIDHEEYERRKYAAPKYDAAATGD